uniref:Transmembrane protein n=1 Tax=Rhodopseudomonas palustris (strain BisA53) TaxID=316055 RepID=Q07VA1_RHOP5
MSIIGFPLLLIPLAVCNIVIFMMPGVSFDAPVATVRLLSGTDWSLTIRDLLVSLGALLLLLEVIKAGRPGAKYVTDHLLSLLVFAAAIGEFVMLPPFGISTVFLLAMLALVDFFAGIALRHRRVRRAAVAAPPRPAAPAAATIAPEPDEVVVNQPLPPSSAVAEAPSPEIASPELQPAAEPNRPATPPPHSKT